MGATLRSMAKRSARERWEALPDDRPAELIGEEIVHWSPGTAGHSNVISVLAGRLVDPFRFGKGGPGGWWILIEPEVELGQQILIPDLAAWHADRLAPESKTKPITVAPDWCCEVLSPSTAARDRKLKLGAYGAAGVRHVWLVDPAARTVEALELASDRFLVQAVLAGDERAGIAPFEAVELDLGSLWLP